MNGSPIAWEFLNLQCVVTRSQHTLSLVFHDTHRRSVQCAFLCQESLKTVQESRDAAELEARNAREKLDLEKAVAAEERQARRNLEALLDFERKRDQRRQEAVRCMAAHQHGSYVFCLRALRSCSLRGPSIVVRLWQDLAMTEIL